MSNPMPRRPEPEAMDIPAEAEAYDRADFAAVNQAFVDRLLEVAGEAPRARAIDLGTGPGDIPIRLLRARPGWRVTAVDVSEAMLSLARANVERADLARSIELVLADAKGGGMPAVPFDVIFSNSIVHHITDVAAFWAQLKRLGRKGTVVFLRDLARPACQADAHDIVDRYAREEAVVLQEEFYRSLLSAYTVEEVQAQLAAAGLDGLEVAMCSDRHWDVWGRLGKG
ncbi:MAG TPA: methyltransferase domain-containing protein [Phycisphaerae bacterium]|nr:methyltransferase domain-containing protein [Phycisphaerae bacterium]